METWTLLEGSPGTINCLKQLITYRPPPNLNPDLECTIFGTWTGLYMRLAKLEIRHSQSLLAAHPSKNQQNTKLCANTVTCARRMRAAFT